MSREDDELNEHEDLRRSASPELRWLSLFEKLSERVDRNAEESRGRHETTQRTIEFIIEQQAKFTTDMQQMREAQAEADRKQAEADRKWEQRWGRTEESIRALLNIAEIHEREIVALAESQAALAKSQAESQARTDEQMKETDERLNALIDTVERMLSERRNREGDAEEGEETP